MSNGYYTYRIRILDEHWVRVEVRNPQNEVIAEPFGAFGYKDALREQIDAFNEAAQKKALQGSQVKAFGEALFNALFDPPLRQNFVDCYHKAVRREKKLLRLELDINEQAMPAVAALPWEFMHLWLGTAPGLIFLQRQAATPQSSSSPPPSQATRCPSPQASTRSSYHATVSNGGTVAQGTGATVVGAGGISIGSNVSGDVIVKHKPSRKPSPAPASPASVSLKQKGRLIKALLACPTISNRQTRNTVLNELPPNIKNNIARSPVNHVDVTNLVNTCLNYPHCIQQLLEIVRFYEGNSFAMQEVEQVVKGGALVERDVHGDVVIDNNEVTYTAPLTPAPVAQAQARRCYLELLTQRCNVLPLAALGGREGIGEEVHLEELYVALDTTSRVELREEEKKEFRRRDSRAEDRPLTALEVATHQRRLVLLGDPGGGKSTFVRQLVAQVAQACEHDKPFAAGWQRGLLPVLTVLRDLAPRLERLALHGSAEAQRKVLMAAIWAQWVEDLQALNASAFAPALREALLKGRVLLVFDGLDEVATAWRARVALAVRALLHSYTKIERIIVTCRIRSYEGRALLHGFAPYTLAPFSGLQIRRFIAAWYQAQARLGRLDQASAESRLDDLQGAALEADLRELASNPMLLTTMTLIHQQEVGLPRERVRLYARAVELLLSRWQKHKQTALSPPLEALLKDERRLRLIMEHLGFEAHQRQSQSEGAGDLPRYHLLGLLEQPTYLGELSLVGEFLDYVDQRAGLLMGRGGNEGGGKPLLYSFPHRTFQEYLAGCQMVRGRRRRMVAQYMARLGEGDYWQLAGLLGAEELFYERAGEQEVLDLAYALCPATPPSSQAEWRGVLWSGLMAVLVGKAEIERDACQPGGDSAYLERLLTRLVQLLEGTQLPPIERAEAGRVLARLGDPRPHVMSVDEMEFCYVPPGPFWMGSYDGSDDERPLHQVDIPYGYWMSRYSVTNAQFMQFVADGGYQEEAFWREAKPASVWKDGLVQDRNCPYDFGTPFNLPNHPVVGITWYEALAFTRWLGQRWGSQIRLPSEAEWEKAARGGLMIPATLLIRPANAFHTPPNLTLIENPLPQRGSPWGDDGDASYTNTRKTGIGHTSAVGCFTQDKSPNGCLEMAGNVLEWTRSLYQSYPYQLNGKQENLNAPSNQSRVLRGGAWVYISSISFGCLLRFRYNPSGWNDHWGFRVFCSRHL